MFYRLNDEAYNVEFFTQTGTPTEILTAILLGTDFTLGTVNFTEIITFFFARSGLAAWALMQFIAYLGGEIDYNGFTISVLSQRGSATPKPLTVGKNVTVMSKAVDKRNLDGEGNPTIPAIHMRRV